MIVLRDLHATLAYRQSWFVEVIAFPLSAWLQLTDLDNQDCVHS